MKTHKPLLVSILKYLSSVNDKHLLTIILLVLAEDNSNNLIETLLAKMYASEVNIIAFEILLYGYKQAIAHKATINQEMAVIFPEMVENNSFPAQAIEYSNEVHMILLQWYETPHLTETLIDFLTKIYKQRLTILEELMTASQTAIKQINNFAIILSSQLVTMKSMKHNMENQKKQAGKLSGAEVDKRALVTTIDKNRQQIQDIVKFEQYAASKIFPTIIKNLKHDYEIFCSKHRFIEEEFKIFLQERHLLVQDTGYSELAATNIYDLLKRTQDDISKAITLGGYDA